MSNIFNDTKIIGWGMVGVVVIAIVLGITKYKIPKLPEANNNLENTNNSLLNTNSANIMPKYSFPGLLPADQIHNQQATIVTSRGNIVVTLDDAQGPLAVSNFVYLAKLGYYQGIRWHRVVPDFVVQAGDPTGTGSGGPGYSFPDEAVTGEYVEGTMAMANAGPNTNGSQFFITIADVTGRIEKNYTIFGHVKSGMEVAKSLTTSDTIEQITIEPAS